MLANNSLERTAALLPQGMRASLARSWAGKGAWPASPPLFSSGVSPLLPILISNTVGFSKNKGWNITP
jgi:hypothetical protein